MYVVAYIYDEVSSVYEVFSISPSFQYTLNASVTDGSTG